MPAEDDVTAHAQMRYTVHFSQQADFIPDATTATLSVTGAVTAVVNGLLADTSYYVLVTAIDESGLES